MEDLKNEVYDALDELSSLAIRDHYCCDDPYYNCPKHPEGSCNDDSGDECNCGGAKHNEKVEELCNELYRLLK